MLSKHFVRTEALDPGLGAFYSDLMEARLDSDYDVFFDPDPEQLRTWLPKAEKFIDTAVSYSRRERRSRGGRTRLDTPA